MLRLGAIATGGNMNSSDNLSFTKGLWLDGCLGIQPRVMRSHWLKASATWKDLEVGISQPVTSH
jgi:hypothetical protein